MKVKILRSTVANGQDLFAGDIAVLPDAVAKELKLMGKACDPDEAPAGDAAPADPDDDPDEKA